MLVTVQSARAKDGGVEGGLKPSRHFLERERERDPLEREREILWHFPGKRMELKEVLGSARGWRSCRRA